LDRAKNTTITGGQFYANCTTQIQARSKGAQQLHERSIFLCQRLPINLGLKNLIKNSATGAVYNSLERQQLDAPKCHPNTRIAVINRIIDWLLGKIGLDALILWLYGAAGAGKSAIAHSLAEICDKHGWLLATFFFWKTAAERSDITRFVTTIAYQIARAIPALSSRIEAAVDADPTIFHQSIDAQLAKLIIGPLRRLHSTGFEFKDSPFVIIVDGLDECQRSNIQSGLVKSLVTAFRDSPLRIRILIASRPEVHLQSTFNSSSLEAHILHLALSNEYSPEEDIYRFLEDSFDKIKCEHPLASYIPSSWPSADVIHELAWRSSGQFIFASTTIKYVGGDLHQLPHRRLDVICRLQPPTGEKDMPYAELNSLYHHVLSDVGNIEAVKLVLGTFIVVNEKLVESEYGLEIYSTREMDDWLSWQPGESEACLSQLASVIQCDEDDDISILHASLSDFLLDPSRSQQFYLCRESVLGDSTAHGLCRLRQKEHDKHCVSILPSREFILQVLI